MKPESKKSKKTEIEPRPAVSSSRLVRLRSVTRDYICPTCKQDMMEEPHVGINGKDCPQCGQGLSWRRAKRERSNDGSEVRRSESVN